MVEAIITALSRIRWLFVIARNSRLTYKGQAVDVKQVGSELWVRYVLEGSVCKAGNGCTGNHIWADHFGGTLDDIFELQDRVASSVVSAIERRLRMSEIERAVPILGAKVDLMTRKGIHPRRRPRIEASAVQVF